MKRIFLIISLVMLMMFAGCTDTKVTSQDPGYEQITAEAAKELMDTETDYVIIDARTIEEFGDKLVVAQINIDEVPEIADQEGIDVIPSLVLYKNGEAIDSIVAPESKAKIQAFIEANL